MLRNTLKISLRNEGVSMQFFLLNMHEDIDFLWSGPACMSLIYYALFNFFYEKYWPRLTSCSKCRGSVRHGDIRFIFSENFEVHIIWILISLSY